MNTELFANLFAAVSLLIVGMLLGSSWTNTCPPQNWLHEWETLTAGMLAVLAAGWTVTEMRRADAKQQIRHDQMFENSRRPDQLKKKRAAFFAELFAALSRDINVSKISIAMAEDGDGKNEAYHQYSGKMDSAYDLTRFKEITEARPLMSVAMGAQYLILEKITEKAKVSSKRIGELARMKNINIKAAQTSVFEIMLKETEDIADVVKAFSESLRKMGSEQN